MPTAQERVRERAMNMALAAAVRQELRRTRMRAPVTLRQVRDGSTLLLGSDPDQADRGPTVWAVPRHLKRGAGYEYGVIIRARHSFRLHPLGVTQGGPTAVERTARRLVELYDVQRAAWRFTRKGI